MEAAYYAAFDGLCCGIGGGHCLRSGKGNASSGRDRFSSRNLFAYGDGVIMAVEEQDCTSQMTTDARLARIEAMIHAVNQRLDEAILTQLRDHGKRIRELEDKLTEQQRICAIELGRQQGSKAMLTLLLSIAGAVGGLVASLLSKL